MRRTALGAHDRKILETAQHIIGVDEVGRGCLAGPVAVGGVVFDRVPDNPLIQDSKSLTARQRDHAAEWVRARSSRWVVFEVWPELIDRINILEAVRLAMRTVVTVLAVPGTVAVVDQVELGDMEIPIRATPKADTVYFSVAAASILAKVHRDRLMAELSGTHPHWGWPNNKGYGTAEHRKALEKHGASYLHRKSFRWSPVLP